MTVVTRFAPSPTGLLHVGGARTALFCWLYARRMGGKFILRVEDTDRERSTEEAVRVILEGMAWLNLDPDEGPFYQTERFDRYRAVIAGMLEAGTAYHCYCTKQELDALREQQIARKEKPRYTGVCREHREPRPGVAPVVRFKNPLAGAVVVEDLVHGAVTFQNAELDDLIIARSDGTPTYNFCVVVDDMDMGLVETGVGLIPGGGGCKEMVLRSIEAGSSIRPDARGEGVEIFEALKKNFETIAKATVSTSAAEARSLGFLRPSDAITMNRERLITDAKHRARDLADSGYSAPIPRTDIPAPGESVLATLKLAVWTMREGQYISDHDAKVANWVAYALSGGNVTPGTLVSEQYLLDLEREAFLSLCGEKKTQERIAFTLKTGKPLRN
jgi:hypothetical protein